MNRKITLPVVLAAIVAVGATSAAGVVAQESEVHTDQAGAIAVSPGPLGRSSADWAGDWLQWWLGREQIKELDCAAGDHGEVFFTPGRLGSEVDCTIGADQHPMMGIFAWVCWTDVPLGLKATPENTADMKGNRGIKLERRALEDKASAYDCIIDGQSEIDDPFITVDGEPITIEDSHLTISTPFVLKKSDDLQLPDHFPKHGRYIGSGYFAMLEPLGPGRHTIEYGIAPGNERDPQLMSIVNVEVVGAATE